MRAKRTILAMLTLTALLTMPGAAGANGGAYLELDRAHYLPGDRGTAVTYVTIPERRETILDQGPFFLFALPQGVSLEEGRPIPMGAVRIGSFAIEEERHQYELTAAFTVPRLDADFYTLGVCNDPCTVSGFRESLSGTISIVATQREADLLNQNSQLHNRIYQLRGSVRRAEHELSKAESGFEFDLANAEAQDGELRERIQQLEASLASAERRASDAARPSFDPWVVGATLALVVAAGAFMFRRRRMLAAVGELP